MKSIAAKLSSLLFVFAISIPAMACEISHKEMSAAPDTDGVSTQVMQRISNDFDTASF